MKYIIILVFTIFSLNQAKSQVTSSGSFYPEKIITKITYKEFTTVFQSLIKEDFATLYIADDYAFYKKEFQQKNFTPEEIMAVDENAIILADETPSEPQVYEIYLNRKKNIIHEFLFEDIALNEKFAVEESLPQMKWEILNEQKKIGEYNCEKAKTTFRGRTYEVWYTPEIPVALGPWKLNGLPGVILIAKDMQGIYSWEVNTIQTLEESSFNIEKELANKSSFSKISFKKFDEKYISKRKENFMMMQSRNSDNNIKLSFDTLQDKEPINEWRTQTFWEF